MAKQHGVYHPTWTEDGPGGARVRRTSVSWAYRFEYGGRTYQKAGFETATAARDARDIRLGEVRAGQEQDWRKFTVQGLYLTAAARKVTWAPNTQSSFDYSWKRLQAFFLPEHLVATIDDTRILGYVGFAQRLGHTRNTIRLDLGYLRAALELAHGKRLLPWVPTFPRLRYERREQTIAPVQLDQILAVMPERWRLYFEATQELGWRARSEVSSRQWSHVDWGPASWQCCGLQVREDVCACGAGRPGWLELDAASNKTRERRLFPMTRVLRSILTRARLRVDQVQVQTGAIVPWVFCRENGARIGYSAKAWSNALRKLGVEALRPGRAWGSAMVPHDLKRSAIRRMSSDGVDRQVRMGLVGHASDSAHTIYEQRGADLEAMREAARLLDQRREGGEPADNVVQLSLFRRGR
jgi:hypothetical protein